MRKTLSLLLLFALLLGLLAGCTATPTTTKGPTATTAKPTTTQQTSGDPSKVPGPGFKFDPPVTVTAVFSDMSAAIGGAVKNEENVWIDLYKEKYGIILEYKWIVDQAQYSERINLMLAGGDLPDFFYTDAIQFQQSFENDQIQAVDEVFDVYASQTTKDLMMEAGMMPFEAVKRDGKMYAIPWTTLAHESANAGHVRQDWLDLYGLGPIKTFADFENVMAVFADKKPGGVAWSISEDQGLSRLYAMAPMFDAFPLHWVEKPDKTLEYGIVQPEMKAAVAKYAEWFAKGYINPEFGTSTGTKRAEHIAAGTIGLNMDPFWHPLAWQAGKNNDDKMELAFFDLPTVSGKPFIFPSVGVGVAGYYLINKNCKNPEAFPLMLNSFIDIFYLSSDKEEGETYINWPDGTAVWQVAFAKAYRHFKNYQQHKDLVKYINKQMSFDELPADTKNVAGRIDEYLGGSNATWGWYMIYGPEGVFNVVGKIIDDKRFHDNKFFGPTPNSMADYDAILKKLEVETFTAIILGNKDISEFDAFVDQWYQLGGREITTDVNNWKKNQ